MKQDVSYCINSQLNLLYFGLHSTVENADDKLLDRCKIQNEKIEHQEKVIEEQNAKIADLEKKLKDIYDVSTRNSLVLTVNWFLLQSLLNFFCTI